MSTHTGKLASANDTRMPSKAPDPAPDSTHKTMPEFALDANELKYPPDDRMSGQKKPHSGTQPGDTAMARSEVPRREAPLMPAAVAAALEAAAGCASACERTAKGMGEDPHHAHHRDVARLCAATCRLTEAYLELASDAAMAVMVRDISAVCARTCEACANLCERHGGDPLMDASAAACRRCAGACRTVAA